MCDLIAPPVALMKNCVQHFSCSSLIYSLYAWMWEEAGVFVESPRKHRHNMQPPHRKDRAEFRTPTLFQLWGTCAIHKSKNWIETWETGLGNWHWGQNNSLRLWKSFAKGLFLISQLSFCYLLPCNNGGFLLFAPSYAPSLKSHYDNFPSKDFLHSCKQRTLKCRFPQSKTLRSPVIPPHLVQVQLQW